MQLWFWQVATTTVENSIPRINILESNQIILYYIIMLCNETPIQLKSKI